MKGLKAAVIFLLSHSFFGCEPGGVQVCKNAGNGWFTHSLISRKSHKKTVKPSVSRLFLVETKRIELSTLRMRTVRSPS